MHDEEMAKHVAESRLLLAQRLAEEGDAAAARLAFESVLAVSTDADVTAGPIETTLAYAWYLD